MPERRLYVAVYLSRVQRAPKDPAETAVALRAALASDEFPYDCGDDPSFFCAHHFGGPITWGVCRPDVRGAIREGDWVLYISARTQADTVTRYRFVAALSVERKLRHTSLSDTPFARYLNLLIRRRGHGWERHEPGLHRRDWHDDSWLWRICRDHGLRKHDVDEAAEAHTPGQPLPLPAASNYVVFSQASAIIAPRSPLIATYRRGDDYETWESDAGAQALRRVILADGGRMLRILNAYGHPHRHFSRPLDPAWPKPMLDALALTEGRDDTAARVGPSESRARSRQAPC
jgi:hypothetical protein